MLRKMVFICSWNFFVMKKTQQLTPQFYLNSINPETLETFSPDQINTVKLLLDKAIPTPSDKLIDLQISADLLFDRFYVAVFVGRDLRNGIRKQKPKKNYQKVLNILTALILLAGLNVTRTTFVFTLLYLFKSLVGIDLLPGHAKDYIP
jgi:hypothetical protein